MRKSRRQHFSAQFYLRNFANPMFSERIWVYERKSAKWELRSPRGVGWSAHLYSMFDERGERLDDFERFLKDRVEDPAVAPLKKAANSPKRLTQDERDSLALFIGVAGGRTPAMIESAQKLYFDAMSPHRKREFDDLVEKWCKLSGRPNDERARSEFLKPGSFGAIMVWAYSIRDRLLRWHWTFVRTTQNQPFVTSDWPMYAEHDPKENIRFVSFPISSEVALIVTNTGPVRDDLDCLANARAMNRQTLDRASEFVVSCQPSFPGDSFLATWHQRQGFRGSP